MRVVVQRVSGAVLRIDGDVFSSIDHGMLVLVGIETGDTPEELEWIADKVVGLRIFEDEDGVMNRSVLETGGSIMAVSQFTLTASTRKGRRPSYIRAERPETAAPVYDSFCRRLEELCGRPVARGVFGADMKITLTNSGPVTIIIDSRLKE